MFLVQLFYHNLLRATPLNETVSIILLANCIEMAAPMYHKSIGEKNPDQVQRKNKCAMCCNPQCAIGVSHRCKKPTQCDSFSGMGYLTFRKYISTHWCIMYVDNPAYTEPLNNTRELLLDLSDHV